MFPPIGLSLFSFGYLGGFSRKEEERACPAISLAQLIDLAQIHGLSGIEIPLVRCIPDFSPVALSQLKERLAANRFFLSIDAEVIDEDSFSDILKAASESGERFVRAKLSKTLGGNRYLTGLDPGEWFAGTVRRLKRAAALARQWKLSIAIENHQDVTSEELVRLIEEIGSDTLKVNLDTGSVLATCEDPVKFAETVGPYLQNIHLKDYRLVRGLHGFRLVRCALGSGVVDFDRIFRAVRARASSDVRASIELGAVVAREVHWQKPAYWRAYPSRAAAELAGFLEIFSDQIESDTAAWQTPWEQGQSHEAKEQIELKELFMSVEFLKSLGAPVSPRLARPLVSLAEISSHKTAEVC
ncbi:MAG: sugar phosphate isomerase/epimerase [Candidatus Omnitrophica bacterium]|nr:sugar phosphate isomerase/epimerase [Candidatus Omnitrophota bacterium]